MTTDTVFTSKAAYNSRNYLWWSLGSCAALSVALVAVGFFEPSQAVVITLLPLLNLFFMPVKPHQVGTVSIRFEKERMAYLSMGATLWFLPYDKLADFEVIYARPLFGGLLDRSPQLMIYTENDSYCVPLSKRVFSPKDIAGITAFIQAIVNRNR